MQSEYFQLNWDQTIRSFPSYHSLFYHMFPIKNQEASKSSIQASLTEV